MASRARIQLDVTLPLGFVSIIWLVYVANRFLPFLRLNTFGIRPRTLEGLFGIFFAPLLHVNLFHVAANTVPLFVLLFLLQIQSGKRVAEVLAPLWILTGAAVWVIGRGGAVHLGASGLVYGLIAFLIAAGFYHRDWRSILVGVFVLLTYGGLLWRIFPTFWFISWESHLCGAAVGVVVASWGRHREKQARS